MDRDIERAAAIADHQRARLPLLPARVRLTEQGRARVLESKAGMVFDVVEWSRGTDGPVAHVADYRFESIRAGYVQIWSLGHGDYTATVRAR